MVFGKWLVRTVHMVLSGMQLMKLCDQDTNHKNFRVCILI